MNGSLYAGAQTSSKRSSGSGAISHLPILVDPSHGTGKRQKVLPLSRAAVAVGVVWVLTAINVVLTLIAILSLGVAAEELGAQGVSIDRPTAKVRAERDRITAEYRGTAHALRQPIGREIAPGQRWPGHEQQQRRVLQQHAALFQVG